MAANEGRPVEARAAGHRALGPAPSSWLDVTPTPIHDARGRVVGEVRGDVFIKHVVPSRHQLRKPRAWCFDNISLKQAEWEGARWIRLEDAETGKTWTAALLTVWQRGFQIDRGHHAQMALSIEYWSREGEEVAEQLALPL